MTGDREIAVQCRGKGGYVFGAPGARFELLPEDQ